MKYFFKWNITLLFVFGMLLLPSCQKKEKEMPIPSPSVRVVETVPSSANKATEKKVDTRFQKSTYPKVDGSTATIPLSEAYARKLLQLSPEDAKAFIKHNTTHNAYENLFNGKADIIFVTEPSMDELKLAEKKKIELEIVPVVKDAFVFLVNGQNPVQSLSLDEIRDIYSGKVKNWKEVGGENKGIIAYQRQKNSGSQTLMENIVMKGLKMMPAPMDLVPQEMGMLIDRVAGYDNSDRAIGYSVYYYAGTMYSSKNIRLLGINGIKPNKMTISEGKYPLSSAYYAVFKKSDEANASSRKLLAFALEEEGQASAEEAGYVRLSKTVPQQ